MHGPRHHPIATNNLPAGETLIWTAVADSPAVRDAARTRAGVLTVFFWLFALSTIILAVASAASVLWLGVPNSWPALLMLAFFAPATYVIWRQSSRNRALYRSEGDIVYALTDKSFLVIPAGAGPVRRFSARDFRRIRVQRAQPPGGKGTIWFGWQAKDIGGKYTEVLHPSGDPTELSELLRQQFGAEVR